MKKNSNFIKGERRAVASVQKAAALSLPSRVELKKRSAQRGTVGIRLVVGGAERKTRGER